MGFLLGLRGSGLGESRFQAGFGGRGGGIGAPWAAGRSIEASWSASSCQALSWLTLVELQPQEQTANKPLSHVIVPR